MTRWKRSSLFQFVAKVVVFCMVIQGWPWWELSRAYKWEFEPQKLQRILDTVSTILSPRDASAAIPPNPHEYIINQIPENFVHISESGEPVTLDDNQDDNEPAGTVSIGFGFEFFGTTYTTVTISENGYITFGVLSDPDNVSIPTQETPNSLIAPFWDDLNPEHNPDSAIYFETLGTAPERQFVVQWNDVPLNADAGSRLTFEAILFEGTNEIQFQYLFLEDGTGQSGSGAVSGSSATIGIESPDGNEGKEISYNLEGAVTEGDAFSFTLGKNPFETGRLLGDRDADDVITILDQSLLSKTIAAFRTPYPSLDLMLSDMAPRPGLEGQPFGDKFIDDWDHGLMSHVILEREDLNPLLAEISYQIAQIGDELILSGSGFAPVAEDNTIVFVDVNGNETAVPAAWVDPAGTELTVTIPAGLEYIVQIKVIRNNQPSNSILFVLEGTPVITRLLPATGKINSTVRIRGHEFGLSPEDNVVTFNGEEAMVIDARADGFLDELEVIVPDAATSGPVTVTVAGETSNAVPFSVRQDLDVYITTPETDSEITAPVSIVGTAWDDNLDYYVLQYAPVGSTDFTQFAKSASSVEDGDLGTFDPTLLENGIYTVRLTAYDTEEDPNSRSVEVQYLVTGNLKIGNFTVSFVDLAIPVSGIPIQVIRTYDSRTRGQERDFGYGWTLSLKTFPKIEKNTEEGRSWKKFVDSSGLFPVYCIQGRRAHFVAVTMPDGRTLEFDFTPEPSCQQLYPIEQTTAAYTARPGTAATLDPVGDTDLIVYEGNLCTFDFEIYDPQEFILTLADGTSYQLKIGEGVSQVEDRNDNTLTFTDDGIIHSSGKSVLFERDDEGRITKITDPNENFMTYTYDIKGDLVTFTDREEHSTQYTYDDHYLMDIIDPRGVRAIRTEYDDNGRIISTTDAEGNMIELTHDIHNRQEVVRDPLGNPTIYEYDEQGNVVAETNALGHRTQCAYDEDDNLIGETDALGHTTTYTYDARGNQLTQTDPLGNVTGNTYNSNDNLLTTTDPLGNVTQNTYDEFGNLLSTIAPDGTKTHFTYDASGNLLTITDAAGNLTRFDYDGSGNLISQTDATGHVTSYTYDANGNRLTETTTYTTPAGVRTVTTRMEYDGENRVVKVIDAEGHVTLTEYNEFGNRVATVDALGRRTQFVYDQRGLLTDTLYPDDTPGIDTDNPRTSSVFDAAGRAITTIDELGRETHFVFDAVGQLVETVYPDNTPADLTDNPRTITEYDAVGQVLAQVDERGNRTEFTYDAAGRQTRVRDALGNESMTVYDAAGLKIAQLDALGHTTSFTCDATGRPTTTTFADGTSTSTTFDDIGRVVERTDQTGRTTGFEYDALGRLTAVVDALGQRTEYAYDEMGNLVRQTDANGHSTTYAYDALGRRAATVLPLGQRSTTTYDAVGKVASTTDFNGQTMSYVYDMRNRLIEKHFGDGSVETFTYAENGLRSTTVDARGTTTWIYNERDRLASRIDPDGRTISYTYDEAGNRTSVAIPSGTTTYTYDALNRLETVTDPDLNVTTYHYDAVSNLVRTDFPNSTVETRSYDDLNRLINLATTGPSGIFTSYEYQLDDVGNRTSVAEQDGRRVEYDYDALYRLVGEDIFDLGELTPSRSIDYTYDPVGNRLSRTDTAEGSTAYTYDENDRLLLETLASDATERTYDDNGNLLSRSRNRVDEVFYHWSQENRLVGVDTNADGAVEVTNNYDVDGIRVAQTVNGEEIRFLIDRNRPFAQVLDEYTPGGIIKVSYVHGLDLISQNRALDGTSHEKTFYNNDCLGSTRVLTDPNGDVVNRYTYDAYGRTIMESGVTGNVYLFAGEARDFNVGLDYLRARWMNPSVGRFVSRDPLLSSLTSPTMLRSYLYAGGNPVNYADPSGLWTLPELMVSVVIVSILTQLAFESHTSRAADIAYWANPERILTDPKVRTAMVSALNETDPDPRKLGDEREQGGSIVLAKGGYRVVRWPAYADSEIRAVKVKGVIATFHTHPAAVLGPDGTAFVPVDGPSRLEHFQFFGNDVGNFAAHPEVWGRVSFVLEKWNLDTLIEPFASQAWDAYNKRVTHYQQLGWRYYEPVAPSIHVLRRNPAGGGVDTSLDLSLSLIGY
ncbi:MAG: RHS repeat-associated core domain-containing protein [Thermodesulfobacteriota bacterium]|nr:RHS repeat-associated core domain-containing protein [Thermodesulfobacteriota bacterium]